MKQELTLSAMTPDCAAAANRNLLAWARVLAVALVGPPGAGKTALIEATARQLRGKARVAVLVLTKAELRRHVMFDRGAFRADLMRINAAAELIEVSAFENTGLPRWLEWLERRRQLKNPKYHAAPTSPTPAECFLG